MRTYATWVLVVLALMASGALAGPIPLNALDADEKGWFYNRRGATAAEVQSDLRSCSEFAQAMMGDGRSPRQMFDGLGFEMLAAAAEAGYPRVYTDDCMISLGYRRFDVLGESLRSFARRFDAMDSSQQSALAGDDEPPEGTLGRQWENSVWLDVPGDHNVQPEARRVRPFFRDAVQRNFVEVGNGQIAPLPDEAVILVSVQRIVGHTQRPSRQRIGDTILIFGQVDPTTGGRIGAFTTQLPSSRMLVSEIDQALPTVTYAYVVPAGTYTLNTAWVGLPVRMLQFCLGTIATEIAPGDVVHLGQFVVRPGRARTSSVLVPALEADLQIRVDLPDLQAARDRLGSTPGLAARLRLAAWRNQFHAACSNAGRVPVYGFDIPGAPNASAGQPD